jgi:hypothetical protein
MMFMQIKLLTRLLLLFCLIGVVAGDCHPLNITEQNITAHEFHFSDDEEINASVMLSMINETHGDLILHAVTEDGHWHVFTLEGVEVLLSDYRDEKTT